jgi:hypothetical protein
MRKIYVFLAIGGMAYVTANENLTGWPADAEFESAGEAIEAVRESDYCLQLDRELLDENKCCGGYSFAGDDYDLWTDDLQPNE